MISFVRLCAENLLFVVMEYCEHGTLTDVIRSDNILASEREKWVRQLAEGLSQLEQLKLLHRDIKTDKCVGWEEGCL